MTTNSGQRDVTRVDCPEFGRGITDAHRVRFLAPPGDWAASNLFVLLMANLFPKGVFDRHPHRGIETVTHVIDSCIKHYENHGNTGTSWPGDALWLTAGRGLIPNEMPGGDEPAHILQLWGNLPRANKLVPAHFQEIRAAKVPTRTAESVSTRVFLGKAGELTSSSVNCTQVTLIEVGLERAAPARSCSCQRVLTASWWPLRVTGSSGRRPRQSEPARWLGSPAMTWPASFGWRVVRAGFERSSSPASRCASLWRPGARSSGTPKKSPPSGSPSSVLSRSASDSEGTRRVRGCFCKGGVDQVRGMLTSSRKQAKKEERMAAFRP